MRARSLPSESPLLAAHGAFCVLTRWGASKSIVVSSDKGAVPSGQDLTGPSTSLQGPFPKSLVLRVRASGRKLGGILQPLAAAALRMGYPFIAKRKPSCGEEKGAVPELELGWKPWSAPLPGLTATLSTSRSELGSRDPLVSILPS